MKMKGIYFLLIVIVLAMVLPVYAQGVDKIKWESKGTNAVWEYVHSDGNTYMLSVSYTVSHMQMGRGPVEKKATAYLILEELNNNSENDNFFGSSELTDGEYNLPTFSNGNRPKLNTTIQVNNLKSDESYDVLINLEWSCTGKKSKIPNYPSQETPGLIMISNNIIFCPAAATGIVKWIDGVDNWHNQTLPSTEGNINHQVRLLIFEYPE